MDWNEAKDQCLDKWRRIRDGVGTMNVATFLDEVTEACAFCDKAADLQKQAPENITDLVKQFDKDRPTAEKVEPSDEDSRS